MKLDIPLNHTGSFDTHLPSGKRLPVINVNYSGLLTVLYLADGLSSYRDHGTTNILSLSAHLSNFVDALERSPHETVRLDITDLSDFDGQPDYSLVFFGNDSKVK